MYRRVYFDCAKIYIFSGFKHNNPNYNSWVIDQKHINKMLKHTKIKNTKRLCVCS